MQQENCFVNSRFLELFRSVFSFSSLWNPAVRMSQSPQIKKTTGTVRFSLISVDIGMMGEVVSTLSVK